MPPSPLKHKNKRALPAEQPSNPNPSKTRKTTPSTPTPPPTPDFTQKCHYIIQHYTCSHKTWLNKPRIRHLWPHCMLGEHYSGADTLEYYRLNHHKTRCTNMASKPKEVRMGEVCANCRPFELGVGVKKGLREFERVIGDEERVFFGEGRDEGERSGEKVDEVEVEENEGEGEKSKVEGDEKREEDVGKDPEGNAEQRPGAEEEQLWMTVKEWPTRGNDVADEGTKVPVRTPSIFGSWANMFMSQGKKAKIGFKDDELMEIWTEVDQDPDWDKIDVQNGKNGKVERWRVNES